MIPDVPDCLQCVYVSTRYIGIEYIDGTMIKCATDMYSQKCFVFEKATISSPLTKQREKAPLCNIYSLEGLNLRWKAPANTLGGRGY